VGRHHGAQCEVTLKLITFQDLGPKKGVPYSRDHLRRLTKSGKFPKPVAVGDHRIGWIEREVDQWLAGKLQARDAAAE
jgi:prophage regulatory protein